MKRHFARYASAWVFILVSILTATPLFARQQALKEYAKPLMMRLNEQIVLRQDNDTRSPDYGGIWCPGCGLYHTRAAEALFPLAYEYELTGNEERLQQAIRLGNWLVARQQPDGAWPETPETWTGTSTDQLLMMLLAWPIVSPHLTPDERTRWSSSMEQAGDYLARVMDNAFASINYCATTAATLAHMNAFLPKPSYAAKARELARMIVAKMNPEYFIEGEGSREGKYKYGVDLGYNMEMSLWGLAEYARVTGDGPVADAVALSLKNHLWFIYPNGMLDASWAIRSNKWTTFGSGTSDGCHPLLALMSDRDEAYITAAVRNMRQLEHSFTREGLLGFGPHYDRVRNAPPCIYPTFTKAKSLAMAQSWVTRDGPGDAPLPTDTEGWRYFPTMNVAVVRSGDFCGTVTAYNYKAKEGPRSKYMHRPAGGSLSILWVDGFDLLQASSQTEYHRWEPMSFPEIPATTPLTPRIEVSANNGYYTNLYEYDAAFTVGERDGAVECTAYGQLKNRDQRPCGVGYTLTHRFGGDRLTKSFMIAHQTLTDTVRIVEPIVLNEGTEITRQDSRTIRIGSRSRTILLTLDSPEATLRIDKKGAETCWSIYPALKALPIVVDVPCDETTRRTPVTLTYRIES